MQEDLKRSVTVVAGIGGSGKTTFTFRYLANAPLDYRFIFDSTGQYARAFGIEPQRDLFDLAIGLCRGWIVFDPSHQWSGRSEEAFAWFAGWAFEKCKELPGRKCIFVEEAWKFLTPRKHPKEIEQWTCEARNYGGASWFNSQRPGKLPEMVRSECSELVCFHIDEEDSLDWPEEKGINRDEIKALPNYQFVARNIDSRSELRGRIKYRL